VAPVAPKLYVLPPLLEPSPVPYVGSALEPASASPNPAGSEVEPEGAGAGMRLWKLSRGPAPFGAVRDGLHGAEYIP
jgi:hypothetical protein